MRLVSFERGAPAWVCVAVAGAIGACSDSGVVLDTPVPRITTTPVATTDHNQAWSYSPAATDPSGGTLEWSVVTRPVWIEFDSAAVTLSGIAGWDHIGSHSIEIVASNGAHATVQRFTLVVSVGEIDCLSEFGDPGESPYVLPYPAGVSRTLTQGYCPPNPTWGHNNWFAYDFDTANGDTLVASRAGRVFAIRENQPNIGGVCGQNAENFVFIEHDDGTIMTYVHLLPNGALVHLNQQVKQGQPIGLSGNSGCSAGPHVHVALFRDRTSFNRQSTLPFNYSNARGPLDARRGLLQGGVFEALPLAP